MLDNAKFQAHILKVQEISRLVKEFNNTFKEGEFFSLKKVSVSHMVPQPDQPTEIRKKNRYFTINGNHRY